MDAKILFEASTQASVLQTPSGPSRSLMQASFWN